MSMDTREQNDAQILNHTVGKYHLPASTRRVGANAFVYKHTDRLGVPGLGCNMDRAVAVEVGNLHIHPQSPQNFAHDVIPFCGREVERCLSLACRRRV
jgi:hypothetical protein